MIAFLSIVWLSCAKLKQLYHIRFHSLKMGNFDNAILQSYFGIFVVVLMWVMRFTYSS
jgi:hypothetical protein